MNPTSIHGKILIGLLVMAVYAAPVSAQETADPVIDFVENIGATAGRLFPDAVAQLDQPLPPGGIAVHVGEISVDGTTPRIADLMESIIEEELLIAAESLRSRVDVAVLSDRASIGNIGQGEIGAAANSLLTVRVRAGFGAERVLFSLQIHDGAGRILVGGRVSAPLTTDVTGALRQSAAVAVQSGGAAFDGDGDVPNTASQARAVALDSHHQNLSFETDGDEDWFTFLAEAAGGAPVISGGDGEMIDAVRIYTAGSTDTYIEVYGPDDPGLLITENDDADSMNASVSIPVTAGGRYWVKVRGFSSSTRGSYELYIQRSRLAVDSMEPNNDRYTATLLTGDSFPIYGSIRPNGDSDWYRISAELIAELSPPSDGDDAADAAETGAVVAYTTGNLDTTMTLYDDAGTEIAYNDDGGEGGNARLVVTLDGAGGFLKVGSFGGGSEGDYALHLQQIVLQHDDFEPDNTAETASPLTFNDPPQRHTFSSESDVDWAHVMVPGPAGETVDVPARQLVTVETYGDVDTYMTLFDASMMEIRSSDDDGYGMNAKIEEYLEPGEYFIQVRPLYLHDSAAEYSLEGRLR